MEAAPQVRLATNAFTALPMATWWPIPLDRVHAIRPGDRLPVGDRTLRAVAPPLFDNPTSTGFVDESTGALFTVDSFGGIIPEPTQDAGDVPPDALAGGMLAWAALDSPWSHLVDRQLFGQVLDTVRAIQPSRIFSNHLPAANGASLDGFLDIVRSVPDAEPFVPPNQEEFGHLVAAIMAAQTPPAAAT